jgi:hypothetical protein
MRKGPKTIPEATKKGHENRAGGTRETVENVDTGNATNETTPSLDPFHRVNLTKHLKDPTELSSSQSQAFEADHSVSIVPLASTVTPTCLFFTSLPPETTSM